MNELIKKVNEDYTEIIKGMDENELKRDFEEFKKNLKENRVHAWGKVFPHILNLFFSRRAGR